MANTNRKRGLLGGISLSALVAACGVTGPVGTPAAGPSSVDAVRVVSRATVPWQPLNPARGDQSPKAGNLWGDLRQPEATGFLVRFRDGFSSPPHIHNVTYRGIVIEGLIHNDDPTAPQTWMSPGSYWVQPAGDVHVTSARGGAGLAYIEIESGPYLVRPPEQAFSSADPPLNVPADTIRWDAHEAGFATVRPWGTSKDGIDRVLVRFPAGFAGSILTDEAIRGVIIAGVLGLQESAEASAPVPPGSFFEGGPTVQRFRCISAQPCAVYYRARGGVRIEAHVQR